MLFLTVQVVNSYCCIEKQKHTLEELFYFIREMRFHTVGKLPKLDRDSAGRRLTSRKVDQVLLSKYINRSILEAYNSK